MAQLHTLPDADLSDETQAFYLAKESGGDRNFRARLSALMARIAARAFTFSNKTLDTTCLVPTGALSERYIFARNILDNPFGEVAQRFSGGVTTGNITIGDGSYGHDRWYALTQSGNAIASTRINEANVMRFMRLVNNHGSAQRLGYAQIVEQVTTQGLRGRPVTLSGRVRTGTSMTIRYALLSWTGTADSVTKDVVNSWTSTDFTTGNFFASSNLAVVATGSIAAIAGTAIDIASVTGSVPSNANNLIVFVWTDATLPNGDSAGYLDSVLQLEQGSAASPIEIRGPNEEIVRCRRYHQLIGLDDDYTPIGAGLCTSSTTARIFVAINPPMRTIPSVSQANLAVTKSDGGAQAASGVSNDRVTTRGLTLNVTVATGLTAGDGTIMTAFNSQGGYLRLSADL